MARVIVAGGVAVAQGVADDCVDEDVVFLGPDAVGAPFCGGEAVV